MASARQRLVLAGTEQVAKVGIWQVCPETGELRWSDNLYRVHGLEPGEGAPSREVLLAVTHPDDRAGVVRYADNVLRERIPSPLDFRVISPKGGIRHLRSTVTAVERDGSHPLLIVGSVQDLTAERRAEREIASRIAATSALAAWESFEQGMEGLLSGLVGALGARAGAAWLPDGDALVAKVFWSEDAAATAEFEATTRDLRLPRESGLPGRVWESKTPSVELTANPECERGEPAADAGLRGLVAIPVVHAGELLAVVELASTEETTLTERFARSLTGIGHEVGEFLAHRRGELVPPPLDRPRARGPAACGAGVFRPPDCRAAEDQSRDDQDALRAHLLEVRRPRPGRRRSSGVARRADRLDSHPPFDRYPLARMHHILPSHVLARRTDGVM